MQRTSGQVRRIRFLTVETILLTTLCLLGTMIGISVLRARLVANVSQAARTRPAHFQSAISPTAPRQQQNMFRHESTHSTR